jgi:DNA-binding transcriptional LysR family regulator
MRSLNLDQLRALTEVVACGSFSAAARRLNLSQPAVSLQVRELEARFGVQLIERMGKQAHATVPGQQLVEVAQRIFEECSTADAIMRRYRKGWLGRVRVGTMLTVLTYQLPPILRRLRAEHPDIELVVNNMPTQDSVANVLANKIDLALVSLPVEDKNLRVTPLRAEMMMAILPADAREVPDAITPEYVARQPLLTEHTRSSGYTLVLGWLGRVEMEREPMPIGTVDTLKAAVADKLGMALVPEAAITRHKAGFMVRPLKPPLGRTLGLIEHRNKPNDPALEIVRNALLGLRAEAKDGARQKAAKG